MSTITKTVLQSLERFLQKQMRVDKLTQPGLEDAANYLSERDKKYGTSPLRVPAVVQQHADNDPATPVPSMIGELLECLDIVPGLLHMTQGTSRPGSRHIRLGSVKMQSNTTISGFEPAAQLDTLPLLRVKPVEPVHFYPCR